MSRYRLVSLDLQRLAVPLKEPFVIATGRVDVTPSIAVELVLEAADGRRASGLGEAAALPGVTRETADDVLQLLDTARALLLGRELPLAPDQGVDPLLLSACGGSFVALQGLETALCDAASRLDGLPLWRWLGGPESCPAIETDITLPILPAARMAELAQHWWGLGFRAFKVKVGKALQDDLASLRAVHAVAPEARLRIDANCGFDAAQSLALVAAVKGWGGALECLEQPCAADDFEGLARVAADSGIPVVADESVKSMEGLERVVAARAVQGINLKLAKSGLLGALGLGRAAQRHGLRLMVGGMVETRLGMTAAVHLTAALGGVAWPDLDTAWLLADDPWLGGYEARGPHYLLPDAPGLGIARRGPLPAPL